MTESESERSENSDDDIFSDDGYEWEAHDADKPTDSVVDEHSQQRAASNPGFSLSVQAAGPGGKSTSSSNVSSPVRARVDSKGNNFISTPAKGISPIAECEEDDEDDSPLDRAAAVTNEEQAKQWMEQNSGSGMQRNLLLQKQGSF